MKNLLFVALATMFLSSCAMHNSYTGNLNAHQTNVVLSESNYVVKDQVTGKAEATYVFGIGGIGKKSLFNAARQDMYMNADLNGKSRALINETFETKTSFFLIVWKKQITTSAHVIEFK